jgi:hypothetical protein
VKYAKNGAWRTSFSYAFFHSQLLEKEAAMAFWALAWQETSYVQTCLVF